MNRRSIRNEFSLLQSAAEQVPDHAGAQSKILRDDCCAVHIMQWCLWWHWNSMT